MFTSVLRASITVKYQTFLNIFYNIFATNCLRNKCCSRALIYSPVNNSARADYSRLAAAQLLYRALLSPCKPYTQLNLKPKELHPAPYFYLANSNAFLVKFLS